MASYGAFGALAILVAACGGGGGGAVPPASSPGTGTSANTSPTSAPTGSAGAPQSGTRAVALSIVIPKRATTGGSAIRSTKYIPSNTASLTLTLLSVNGQTQTGSVQGPFNLTAPTAANPNPNCTVVAAGTSCTFQVNAPIGTDIFSANTFSQPNGTSPLGSGAIALTVQANAQNSASLSLTGPIATVSLFSSTTALTNGNPLPQPTATQQAESVRRSRAARRAIAGGPTPSPSPSGYVPVLAPALTTSRLFVIALDATQQQIINPTTFDNPVVLTLHLNGAPASALALNVTYAGLSSADQGSASTSADGGQISIYAPTDQVTLTLSTSVTSAGDPLAPSVGAAVPQNPAVPAAAPLVYSANANPPGPLYGLTISHAAPLSVGVAADLTASALNVGTAAGTDGSVVGYISGAGINGFDTTDTTFWSCSINYGGYDYGSYTCARQMGQSIAPHASAPPILINVTAPYAGNVTHDATINNILASAVHDDIPANGNAPTPGPTFVPVTNASSGIMFTQVAASFTATLSNSGGGASSGNVVLNDTLPANFALTSASGTNWACAAPTGSQSTGLMVACTYSQPIAPQASAPPITLAVTPQLAARDTTVSNVATGPSGANASAQVSVQSPISFVSSTYAQPAAGIGFTPGDNAVLDFGTVPSPNPGLVGIQNFNNYTGNYTLSSPDGCLTSGTIDNTFDTSLSSTPANGGSLVTFPLHIASSVTNGTCSLTIQDTSANQATLTINVEAGAQGIIQSRRSSR